MDNEDTTNRMVIDQTLLTTPQPRACSTDKKQRLAQNDLLWKMGTDNPSFPSESFGILSADDVDLTPTLEKPRAPAPNHNHLNAATELQRQRSLAESVLSGKVGLTSMYLKSMIKSEKKLRKASESTIDDSDFLSSLSTKSFCPNDVSTPRSSGATVELEASISSGLNIAGNISILADKLKNTDVSIKDLCKEYENIIKSDESIINDTFLSSDDQAANMILQDEQAWHQEYDTMPQLIHDSVFSNLRESIIDEKHSMGEYFQVKSEDCSSIFTKQSPIKEPSSAIALLSNSTMMDGSKNSSIKSFNISNEIKSSPDYNVSDIVRLLSNDSISKSCLFDCLLNDDFKMRENRTNTRNEKSHPKTKEPINATNREKEVATLKPPQTVGKRISPTRKKSLKLEVKIDLSNRTDSTLQWPQSDRQKSSSPTRILPTNIQEEVLILQQPHDSVVSKKVDYTDTFASGKLLTSSCKSSLEDSSDKENTASAPNVSPCGNVRCSSPNSPNRSLTSMRSGSSLDHLIDGRVPVESTKVELVWATVRVGKVNNKDFVLRNKMHQKIRFQIIITGSNFKFVKPEGDSQVPISILLHPLESRSFTVAFAPTTIGAVSERLMIQSASKTAVQGKASQKILLYGYGGHISPEVRNLLKDSTGKYWLSLGIIDEINEPITKNFSITNSGNIPTFVSFTISLKYLQVFTGLTITPNVAVIPAGYTHQFHVRYTPNKDDICRLNYSGKFTSNVCEVVAIKCVFGAEATRGRIRRLAAKLDGNVNTNDMLLTRITELFPEECIPSDIRMLSESVSSLKYLVQHLDSKEIIVTIEQDMERTIIPNHNDSTSFQSLFFDNTNDVTSVNQNSELFNVYPKVVVLNPKMKNSDVIFLVNRSDESIHYETQLSEALVNVLPKSGIITPLNTSMVKIICKEDTEIRKHRDLKLTIYSDNYSVEVNIQLMFLNIPS